MCVAAAHLSWYLACAHCLSVERVRGRTDTSVAMATLDEINSGYVSAEDEDFVPDGTRGATIAVCVRGPVADASHHVGCAATVMQEAAARAAQRVQAAKSQSTAELIRARKAKSSAASMWAAMRGEDTAPVASSTAKPEDSKGAQAPTDDGKGGKKKKKTKGNKTHKESTKKGSGGKKKRRRAKDILAMLNRPSKAKGAKAKQVQPCILSLLFCRLCCHSLRDLALCVSRLWPTFLGAEWYAGQRSAVFRRWRCRPLGLCQGGKWLSARS